MTTRSETRYAVTVRPGYFGGNTADVFSTHSTLQAAMRAMRSHTYTDEKGKRRYPACVVEAGTKRKGDVFWGDMFPHIIA